MKHHDEFVKELEKQYYKTASMCIGASVSIGALFLSYLYYLMS